LRDKEPVENPRVDICGVSKKEKSIVLENVDVSLFYIIPNLKSRGPESYLIQAYSSVFGTALLCFKKRMWAEITSKN